MKRVSLGIMLTCGVVLFMIGRAFAANSVENRLYGSQVTDVEVSEVDALYEQTSDELAETLEVVNDGFDNAGEQWPDSPEEALGGDVSVYDVAPCGGGGGVTLDDILAMLAAFGGNYACNCPGSGGGQWASNGTNINNTNTGNVGIGTTLPNTRLHVVGDAIFVDDFASPCHFLGRRANGSSTVPTATLSGDDITKFIGRGYGATAFDADGQTGMVVEASQNWTDSAQGARLKFLTTTNGAGSSTEKLRIDHDGVVRLYNDIAGETIGLDTADSSNSGYITLRMWDGTALNDTVSIEAEESGGGGQIVLRNEAGSMRLQVDGDGSQDEGFITIYNGAGVASITLDGQDTSGNGRVITQVLEITGGSDLSEQFQVDGSNAMPQAGSVVCIDPKSPGRLTVCAHEYDRTVAGVISGAGGVRPGMMMGQKDSVADGQHPVALTGRVYVWADASFGSVEPGDLLTTSNTLGHAMKVVDHAKSQGAIIGKAMTSLDSGTGLVLVLVALQ